MNPNEAPRPEAEVSGRPPRGGRLREVAPVGGVEVRGTPVILGHSAPASPTGSPARPCVFSTASVRVAGTQSFLGGKHAGSLEALRVARPKAVDLEYIQMTYCIWMFLGQMSSPFGPRISALTGLTLVASRADGSDGPAAPPMLAPAIRTALGASASLGRRTGVGSASATTSLRRD
jgi:hypothetical protein